MKENKKAEISFLAYLKRKALKTIKDVTTLVYTFIFIGAVIYTAFDEGIEYALRYFFITAIILFLIYFYAMVILFVKYRNISKNSWILYFIILTTLAIVSFFVLNIKQISYLTVMSLVVVIICMGVPYLVEQLRNKLEK